MVINNLYKGDYIEDHDIRYGCIRVDKLGSRSPFFVTFEAEAIYLSKKDIYLLNKPKPKKGESVKTEENEVVMNVKVNNQSQKLYVTSDMSSYNELKKLIGDEDNWEKETVGKIRKGDLKKENDQSDQPKSVLSVLRKEYNEITVSNLLAYFIEKDNDFWCAFAKDILNLPQESIDSSKRRVIRESFHNIDILIELDKDVIVLEHKIKSGINGIKEDGTSQFTKYHKAVTDSNSPYKGENYHKWFFILRPNYNNEDYKKHEKGSVFKEIKYSKIKPIVDTLTKNYSPNDINDIHYILLKELQGLCEKHSKDFDNELFEVVNERFIKQIKSLLIE